MKDEDHCSSWDSPGEGAPAELVRALRALGNERPNRAHLEHLAARLDASLIASVSGSRAEPRASTREGASSAPTRVGSALAKATTLRLVVAALTLSGVGLWLSRSPAPPQPAPLVLPAHGTPRFDAPVLAAPASTAPVQVAPPPELAATNPARAAGSKAKPARGVPSKRALGHASEERRAGDGARLAPPPIPAAVAAPEPAKSCPDDAAGQHEPGALPAPPAPAPRAGEVELLLEARRALKAAPEAALRVLDEHRTRFADGVLAPEREVLAIEALRLVGDASAAAARLRAFQARYPKSMHLLRLERKSR